jgi:tRNA (guanine9-N1)-methyltransferase
MNKVDVDASESSSASADLGEETNLFPPVPTVSKNQLKRLRRDEYLRDKKKQRKEAEKAAKRARSETAAAKGDERPEVIVESEFSLKDSNSTVTKDGTRPQKRAAEIAEFLNRCDKNYSIIIDCNWESSHSESDLRSLSQQIMFCYSCNKNSSNSSNIILSGVGPLLKAKLEKMHCNNWVGVAMHTNDVLNTADKGQISSDNAPKISLPEKESIIYLTSDAEETIHSLDPTCSYVIGGIVDRNRLKGATYKKAKELGIRTAKLPIKEYFALSATHVLTVST